MVSLLNAHCFLILFSQGVALGEVQCMHPSSLSVQPPGGLGKWVSNQRRHNNQGLLKPDRKQKLESIGFVWKLREGTIDSEMYDGEWEMKYFPPKRRNGQYFGSLQRQNIAAHHRTFFQLASKSFAVS